MTPMTTTADDELMTIREVSTRIRRHRVTVSRLIRDGELRAIRGKGRNGRVLIYATSVNEYLERNAVEPAADEAS